MNRKRMNKKGWLRILEAVIAITLIIGTLLYLMSANAPKKDISNQVYDKEKYILNLISNDNVLRNDILNNNTENINNTIMSLIPGSWNFQTKICPLNVICSSSAPLDKEVYATEVVISSTDDKYDPKKLILFIWVK